MQTIWSNVGSQISIGSMLHGEHIVVHGLEGHGVCAEYVMVVRQLVVVVEFFLELLDGCQLSMHRLEHHRCVGGPVTAQQNFREAALGQRFLDIVLIGECHQRQINVGNQMYLTTVVLLGLLVNAAASANRSSTRHLQPTSARASRGQRGAASLLVVVVGAGAAVVVAIAAIGAAAIAERASQAEGE